MAQKMTKKERREAAKAARIEAQKRAAKQRMLRRIYSMSAVVAVIALIVFFVVRSNEGSQAAREDLNALAAAASCDPLETPVQNGREHVATPVQYESTPPTSGNHAGGTGPTGVIAAAVPAENMVHNLEHGHVGLWYAPDAPEAVVTALNEVVNDDPTWRFSIQQEGMPTPIAFSAWGTLMRCDGTGAPEDIAAAARAFVEVTGRNAPEDIPGTAASGAPIGG